MRRKGFKNLNGYIDRLGINLDALSIWWSRDTLVHVGMPSSVHVVRQKIATRNFWTAEGETPTGHNGPSSQPALLSALLLWRNTLTALLHQGKNWTLSFLILGRRAFTGLRRRLRTVIPKGTRKEKRSCRWYEAQQVSCKLNWVWWFGKQWWNHTMSHNFYIIALIYTITHS
jgi:hypothetical protein